MAQTQNQENKSNGTMNGIDLTALNAVIEAVKQQPQIAKATFGVDAVTRHGF